VLGIDAESYLHTFLYRTNRPQYRVSSGSGMIDGQPRTAVRIAQIQTNPDTTFRARLELRFSGSSSATVIAENSEWQSLYFYDLGFTPVALSVDPDYWVLRTVSATTLVPTILNTALDNSNEAQDYSETLVGIGGTSPYTWSLLSGTLPDGITLSSGGLLSGTPTEYGNFTFTAQLRDNLNVTDTREFTLFIQGYPRAPQELVCLLSHPDSVRLHWQSAGNAEFYEVYRSSNGDFTSLTPIASTPDTFFTDFIPETDETIQFYQVISSQSSAGFRSPIARHEL
jgi:hypothetical protein